MFGIEKDWKNEFNFLMLLIGIHLTWKSGTITGYKWLGRKWDTKRLNKLRFSLRTQLFQYFLILYFLLCICLLTKNSE